SSCSGVVGFASRRRSRSPSPTLTLAAVVARAPRQGWSPPRERDGRLVWEQLRPWLTSRRDLPIETLFCVIDGPTRGRPWSSAAVRVELRRFASQAGVRRRFAPHQLRHAHAIELAHEGIPVADYPEATRACPHRDHLELP